MRRGIILVLMVVLVMIASPVMAEQEPATQLERFMGERGRIVVKEFYDVGRFLGPAGIKMMVRGLVIYQPGGIRLYGLRIGVKSLLEEEGSCFLDFKEVASLLEALDYIIGLSKKWASVEKEYTEVIFSTEGGFEIGFYQEGLKQKAFCEVGRVGSISIPLEMKDLETIKLLVDKGLVKLKSLGAE